MRAGLVAAGSATGVGSLPGTDPDEAAALVFGELPDLPHLPELPARGAGADMIGRGAALLVDLPVELGPSGWRLTSRGGRDLRRARDFLAFDLDAVGQQADGYDGPLKVQVVGPLTLAAAVELPNGNVVLTDHGAVAELAASLADGVRAHLAELAIRVPQAQPIVQVDEPSLPAVLAGAIPTASGYGTVRAVESAVARDRLGLVLGAAPEGARVVHCCAADVPVALLREAGADAVSVDLDREYDLDALGEAVDGGTQLWLGAVPSVGPTTPTFAAARDRILALWHQLGFADAALADAVVVTPACGLAGATPRHARAALRAVRDAGRALVDLG